MKKKSVQVMINGAVVVAAALFLLDLGEGAQRYSPQALEYIQRAKAKLRQEEQQQAREAVEEQIRPLMRYYIASGDTMEVYVWGYPDLTKDVVVGPDGKISYPLVGREVVAGLTIEQLEGKISEKLATYIKYPQVSVMMKSFIGSKIIILGEVNRPGIYQYQGGANLLEALASSGDFTKDARQDSIIVVRGNLSGRPEVRRINLARIIKQGVSDEDILLAPNDVVYVPKSFIANLQRFLNLISPTISRATSMMGLREPRNVNNMQDLVTDYTDYTDSTGTE